jgi:hypothetical protein
MHRALQLPEIVTSVLDAGKATPGLLFSCLRVNELFFSETCRILWYGCGEGYKSDMARHPTPKIEHLGCIVQNDGYARSQLYANYIRILAFGDTLDKWGHPMNVEFMYHDEMSPLQYPLLEEVRVNNCFEIPQSGEQLLLYARPSVTKFEARNCSDISNVFFDTLSQQCPNLRRLTLELDESYDHTFSADGLVRYLKNVSLGYLDLWVGFDETWIQGASDTVSSYPALEQLRIPRIESEWLVALGEQPASRTVLPHLKELRVEHTESIQTGLQELQKLAGGLVSLHIVEASLDSSHHLLSGLSQFTNFRRLRVAPLYEGTIFGSELLQLSQACPNMVSLIIGGEEEDECGFCPSNSSNAVGITDALMQEFAKNLPNLEELLIKFEPHDCLTFDAVSSLCQYWQNLQKLTLPCTFDLVEALDERSDVCTFFQKMTPRTSRLKET